MSARRDPEGAWRRRARHGRAALRRRVAGAMVASLALAAVAAAAPPGDGMAQAGVWVRAGDARARVLGLAWNRAATAGRFERPTANDEQGYVSLIVSVRARGFWALPEVGDEVTISFLEGDPDRPVVIGLTGTSWDRPDSALPPQSGQRKVRITYKAMTRRS